MIIIGEITADGECTPDSVELNQKTQILLPNEYSHCATCGVGSNVGRNIRWFSLHHLSGRQTNLSGAAGRYAAVILRFCAGSEKRSPNIQTKYCRQKQRGGLRQNSPDPVCPVTPLKNPASILRELPGLLSAAVPQYVVSPVSNCL